jgi:ribonuclease HI
MDPIVIYTDGAHSEKRKLSGVGVYLQYAGQEKFISENIGYQTNNIAELTAIKTGLESLNRYDIPVAIVTDSAYCIGVLTLDWHLRANKELILEIRGILGRFNKVRFVKVRGHRGIPGNVVADKLATGAIKPEPANKKPAKGVKNGN